MTFQRATSADQPAGLTTVARPPASEQRVGRMSYVGAETAWPSGAAPLARWLRANPDALGEVLGTKLQATDEEVAGGLPASVFVDAGGTRTLALLELGASSEATLGSLLTRLGSVQATVGVWICGEPRDEHVSAASWLNHSVSARFYVVRIRAARIDDSAPAPILQAVLRPPRGSAATTTDGGTDRARRVGDHSEIVVDLPSA